MTPRAAKRIAARTSAALALGALIGVAWVAWAEEYALERELWLLRATGYTGLGALFLALSMTPIDRVARRVSSLPAELLPALRRSFGLTAASLGALHAVLALTTYLRPAPEALLLQPVFRAGALALLILGLLALTSFPPVVRWLRISLWKHLHVLAYVAALFLFQHLMLSAFAPRGRTLWLFGGLLGLGLLRLLPVRAR